PYVQTKIAKPQIRIFRELRSGNTGEGIYATNVARGAPMDKASEAILGLKPVSFRYKKEIDPDRILQFGLVAEDVEKVDPDLVVRDGEGRVYSIRYEAMNAMLLNEFLKAHRKIEEQQATIAQLKSTIAQQMEAVTARLKEHDAQIQKVNDKVELNKPAPQTVASDQLCFVGRLCQTPSLKDGVSQKRPIISSGRDEARRSQIILCLCVMIASE